MDELKGKKPGLIRQTEEVELLKATEVKRILNCSIAWVYKAADRGLLPCVRLPSPDKGRSKSLVRFKKADILQFIESNYCGGKKPGN